MTDDLDGPDVIKKVMFARLALGFLWCFDFAVESIDLLAFTYF
ncbi:hypothetical protein SP39_26 [Salmonella phage 39]|nr:hypothetical protein SP39_26 [Salmonella phage 39]